MGLLNFKKAEKRAETVVDSGSIGGDLLRALIGGDKLTKKEALEIPAVRACISLIAQRIASLPLKLYDRSGGEVSEVADDVRAAFLNGDTGDTLNSTELINAWVEDYFLSGGAYTYIEKNSVGRVTGLYYVDSGNVSVNFNCQPIYKRYSLMVGGRSYEPYEFIKILRNTGGDGRGHSIIEENPLILSVAYNTMKYENQLVKKGGNKKGFLKSKTRLSADAMAELKRAWRELYSNNSENMIILNDGMEFAESSSTSVEMQLNERKLSAASEICSLFGVPPEMLSGKASEGAKTQFFEGCISPLLTIIEAALDSDLLLEAEKDHRYFAFDTREMTRGDIQKRYNAYAVALQSNIMQLDEVRRLEDLPPLGFNFIKLGLQDVLFNPVTKEIYTPNTNASVKMDELGAVLGGEDDSKDMELRYNPYHDARGRFASGGGGGSGVDKSGGSGIITVEAIGRSVGAKAKNYDVYNPKTGDIVNLVEGSRITKPKDCIMAGKGRERQIDEIDFLVSKYGGDPDKWQKVKGFGYVYDDYGEKRKVELHWYENPECGKVEMKIKIRNGVEYIDDD